MRKLPFDPYFAVGVVSTLLIGGVYLARSNADAAPAAPVALEAELLERARAVGAHFTTGNGGAVEVVEITDLQCPACRAADASVSPVLAALAAEGRITRTVFDAPLASHPTAIPASVASGCAARVAPELRAPFRSQVYARQAEWSEAYPPEAALLAIAHQVGIDSAAVRTCMEAEGREQAQRYRSARGVFGEAGLNYVPVFAVNGRVVPWSELEATLRRELGAAE